MGAGLTLAAGLQKIAIACCLSWALVLRAVDEPGLPAVIPGQSGQQC